MQEFYFAKLNTVLKVKNTLNTPILGTVPIINNEFSFNKKINRVDEKLISNMDSPLLLTEEFRKIRTNVQFLMSQKELKTILVTSPIFGEGKSLVSGNLAIIMALAGKKTVFVDADLRYPVGRELFNLPERKGLTTIISGHKSLEQVIQDTETENLSFISAGPIPPNPTEVLSSDEMKQYNRRFERNSSMSLLSTLHLY